MKKHLFYSLLFVFLATAIVTLLGVTGMILVKEPYLGWLVTAFLIEGAGVTYTIVKGTNFFSEDVAPKPALSAATATVEKMPLLPPANEPKAVPEIQVDSSRKKYSLRPLTDFESSMKLKHLPNGIHASVQGMTLREEAQAYNEVTSAESLHLEVHKLPDGELVYFPWMSNETRMRFERFLSDSSQADIEIMAFSKPWEKAEVCVGIPASLIHALDQTTFKYGYRFSMGLRKEA